MRKLILIIVMPLTAFLVIGYAYQGESNTCIAWFNCLIYQFWLFLELKPIKP